MGEWVDCKWGDVVTLQRGYDITKNEQVQTGSVPVVSSGGIASYHDKSMNDGPGVVIGRKGTLGRVHYIDGEFWPHDTTLWVKDFKGNHPRFVYYALKSLDPVNLNVGSASPTLNRNHVHPLPVRWPTTYSQQEAIAEVLGALDDKIAANYRVVSTCEALIAETWRTSWKTRQVPLSTLAKFVNGRAYTRGATGTGRVVVRIAEINSGIGGSTVYNDIEVPDENLARPGDLLFAWSGSLTVARWYRAEAIINQHIFKVVPVEGCPKWFVHQALLSKLLDFRATASDKATTMGHIQRHHLDESVPVPEGEEFARIGSYMESCWNLALAAETENLRLIRTRDELLPLLMSGKLTVKGAEERVSDVL